MLFVLCQSSACVVGVDTCVVVVDSGSGTHGVVVAADGRVVSVADGGTCAETLRLPPRVQDVLSVHRARVEGRSFVRGKRVAQAVVAARDLHRLVLHVVVRLATDAFLSFKILMGHAAALVVVTGLGHLEVLEAVARLGTNRAVLLVARPASFAG